MRDKLIFPAKDMPQLFHAVQMSGIFSDSKTFADAESIIEPQVMENLFLAKNGEKGFDLKGFVEQYFTFRKKGHGHNILSSKDVMDHIKGLWQQLKREDLSNENFTTKISLPYPYVVPGGRFDEIYYWDSYFTMVGLIACGELTLAHDMYRNFAWMIERLGHIPNGNRSYFLSRSQPPFFSLMTTLMLDHGLIKMDKNLLVLLTKEYNYWKAKTVDFVYEGDKMIHMFRYWDSSLTPREESYSEDIEMYDRTKTDDSYLHLRAACESGWDFSSRWCENELVLDTIRTADILPIDLNCLMIYMELLLARVCSEMGHEKEAEKYLQWAKTHEYVIQTHFYDENKGYFYDWDINGLRTEHHTLAGMFPLFFNIATKAQALCSASNIEKMFLKPGGVVTTDVTSGQQWDAPNGWAPLQYITVMGLINYGNDTMANEIMKRWCQIVENEFVTSGKLMEKYNVVTPDVKGGGGEYPNQDGFGWTNAVYVIFKNKLKKLEDKV